MKKYNLSDFLDWCKNNTKFKRKEILRDLKNFYDLKNRFPDINLYIKDYSGNLGNVESIGLMPPYIVKVILD